MSSVLGALRGSRVLPTLHSGNSVREKLYNLLSPLGAPGLGLGQLYSYRGRIISPVTSDQPHLRHLDPGLGQTRTEHVSSREYHTPGENHRY